MVNAKRASLCDEDLVFIKVIDFSTARRKVGWSMVPKSGNRFSEKIMLKQKGKR
ncbi:hypothetical protein ACMYR2_1299 [Nitrobacter sp. TKz-YC01]